MAVEHACAVLNSLYHYSNNLLIIMTKSAAQKAARANKRAQRKAGSKPANANKKQNKPRQKKVLRPRVSRGIGPSNSTQRGRLIGEVYTFPYKEECLGSFTTSVAFANTTYVLNAGNSTTFPWLGSIAPKFEYYRFKKLGLKFVSSSADAVGSTNTALGTILINTNYDVLDASFASQIEMEDYGGGKMVSEACPDKNQYHAVEPNGLRGGVAGGWRYVIPSTSTTAATQPYPSSSSAHDYDIGLLQVASAGVQAASVAGRIYMCYQVEFANPKLVPGAPVGGVAHFSSLAPTSANCLAGMVLQNGATLGGLTASGNTLTFPANIAGNYLVSLLATAATSYAAIGVSSVTSGVTSLNLLCSSSARDATSLAPSLASTTSTYTCAIVTLNVTSAGGTIVFSPGVVVGAAGADLFITALPASILTLKGEAEDEKLQSEIDIMKNDFKFQIDSIRAMIHGRRSLDSDYEDVEDKKDSTDMEKSVYLSKSAVAKLLGR